MNRRKVGLYKSEIWYIGFAQPENFSGFHFLIACLKALKLFRSFILDGTISHIFGPIYDTLSVP